MLSGLVSFLLAVSVVNLSSTVGQASVLSVVYIPLASVIFVSILTGLVACAIDSMQSGVECCASDCL